MDKRGQVAIYVIIAIAIVGIVVAFLFLRERFAPSLSVEIDLKSGIEKCVSDSVNEGLEIMLPQGGFIEPKNFRVFNKTKISYLCYVDGNFKPCINQHPVLTREVSEEVKSYIMPRIENCIETLTKELEKRGNKIEGGDMGIRVNLVKGKVVVEIDKKIVVEKLESKKVYDGFKIEVMHPVYEMLMVAEDIVNSEIEYCSFEYTGYMLMHPEIDIRLYVTSYSEKIYTLKDNISGKTMKFAIRGCVIPAGF